MKKKSSKSEIVVSAVLDYLSSEEDANLLSEVTETLEREVAKVKKADEIVVTSAVKLSQVQLAKIKIMLQKKLNVKFPIVNEVDKNLIAGFTISVNDWYLDASVNHEMDLIKRSLLS